MKIVDLLRAGKYPNSKKIVDAREKKSVNDRNELDDLRCSEKNAKRDIKLLQEEFHCPLAYDRASTAIGTLRVFDGYRHEMNVKSIKMQRRA